MARKAADPHAARAAISDAWPWVAEIAELRRQQAEKGEQTAPPEPRPGAHRTAVAAAVRGSLALLAEELPGHAVEVRVPPFGAVQCVEGPRHTRGTPPNVVETDAATWLLLAAGEWNWEQAAESGRVALSGIRAGDIAAGLPVLRRAADG